METRMGVFDNNPELANQQHAANPVTGQELGWPVIGPVSNSALARFYRRSFCCFSLVPTRRWVSSGEPNAGFLDEIHNPEQHRLPRR
jgi:hypothetical protein